MQEAMTYPGADNIQKWKTVQAEREKHLREMVGPELDDWLEWALSDFEEE